IDFRFTMNNERMWALVGLLLLINGSVSATQIGKVVANLRLSLYYTNPEHEAADGYCDRSFNDNWCDTYFNICVTSSNSSTDCNLYSTTTETHYDKSHVKYAGKEAFRIPLQYPIPESIRIKISAYDNDRFTSHDLIANFENQVVEVPVPNTIVSAGLVKTENTGHNEHVNITAILTVECIKGFYGERCSIECFPEKYPSMLGCHENGTSICLPGFRGQFCEKPDACFYRPCIPGAECVNVDTSTGYKCICGGSEGAHCYAGYNPCVPSPCENQGQCVRTGGKHDTFTCNCPIQWTGKLCNVQRSPCEVASQKLANADLQDLFGMHKKDNYTSLNGDNITMSVSVCKNGGTCVDLMEDFKFICNCTSGWKGELCTIPDWTNAIIAGCVVSGLVVILLCAIVPCCLRLRVLRRRKPQIPVEPLVYSHGDSKCPITERIPFKDVFYNSVIMSDTTNSQDADNTQQFYEYCTVTSPSSREGDSSTFTPNDYEISVEEKPPPELPVRPDSLAPLPKPHNTSICQDHDSLPSSRSESVYSRQPLLTPRTSGFLTALEGGEHNSQNSGGLPKRSVEDGESTLTRLFRIAKK
ncbi:Protein jagged-1a, partial [Taenia solium]